VVEGAREIIPGISVIPVPGHTPGCQAVLIDLNGRKTALTGFCSIQENFEPPEKVKKNWPVIPIGVCANSLEAYDSMLKLKQIADLVIPTHSMEYAEKEVII
jgi:glyoxylase-like metal-dependent hydrolase (beta-lactamase superfamily II)